MSDDIDIGMRSAIGGGVPYGDSTGAMTTEPKQETPDDVIARDSARFFENVDASGGPYACHRWMASVQTQGYGQIRFMGKNSRAHRVAWLIAFGRIPAGLMVLHKCNNKRCVNVAHLYIGNAFDNAADAVRDGLHVSPYASATKCRNGHPFDALDNRGFRTCSICRRVYRARWKEKQPKPFLPLSARL